MAGNAMVDHIGGGILMFPINGKSKENCLADCLNEVGAKGCHYASDKSCHAIFEKAKDVTGGDGRANTFCWKFNTGKGKSQYCQKKMEFKVPHRCHYAEMKNINQITVDSLYLELARDQKIFSR